MLFQIGIPLIIIVITGLLFNPYLAFKPRDNFERWTTRELSYGHPYYWKKRYCSGKQSNDDYPLHLGWLNNERYEWCDDTKSNDAVFCDSDVNNLNIKRRSFIKNIMYIE